ncbi:ribosomal large subunit pseudouridine synthase D [Hyphomicrobium nitrativorans NL23]|uniref:Pseudouridine synthase n=1 Tax=Hyphomicrobium nitrativorans NL23 TaxID=1029756 RepID=V5SE50_9HYPH|nr:RluA family pseudouridine synthase [Hyphomicrobium nitrativorans]AHB48310.1 ribosomal large subunit pseudouridine synthase D [Hyphomicrobium nitrativorans NL23]
MNTDIQADPHDLIATADDAGQRLDRFLATHIGDLSRARLQTLIREGHVSGPGGRTTDPGAKVKAGDAFRVTVPPPEPAAPAGETIPLTVVHEDADLIVIDKPAGLVVHPAAGHATGTLVNALIAHCGDDLSGIGGVKRPGIVHRLDKDTSGLLVVAKSDAAHRGLAEQFATHGEDGRLTRTYEAFVWGTPDQRVGSIDANLGRSTANRTRIAVMRGDGGRRAVTHYEIAEAFVDADGKPLASRLRLNLETGRTHQIRVHLAHIGHPVMGDAIYGAGFKASAQRLSAPAKATLERLGRQALHAVELGFVHPATDKPLHFTSPRPADIQALYEALKGTAAPSAKTSRRGTKSNVSKR